MCIFVPSKECSMRLLLFNPENDLALAANDPHYTPPASAVQMRSDLHDLPHLWQDYDPRPLSVWGWSPLLLRQLREAGVEASFLPTEEQVEAYRQASSRHTAVVLLQRLRTLWPEPFGDGVLVGESQWCCSPEAVSAAVASFGDEAILKAPWSGSGRGVKRVLLSQLSAAVPWVRRTLQRQGAVEVEPLYNKVLDFAVEFWSEGGSVRDEGLSVFTTTPGGVYSGNLVASEEEKLRRLSEYIDVALLSDLRQHLVALLDEALHEELLPAWYTGPLGIDMMVVEDTTSGRCQLHPFLELNLRMTMGWVALQLSHRQPSHQTRLFRILQEGGRYRYVLD